MGKTVEGAPWRRQGAYWHDHDRMGRRQAQRSTTQSLSTSYPIILMMILWLPCEVIKLVHRSAFRGISYESL